jgi:hypothetical protein
MVHKIINTREQRTMTKNQETAVIREFERFQPEGSTHIRTPQKEHLNVEFRPGVCCEHEWNQVSQDEESVKFIQKTFEETDIGDRQTICSKCQAMALWEKGELFAYDAIALVEKLEERKPSKPARRERR